MVKKKARKQLKLDPAEDTSHINAIIYGLTDAGKTHLCGTANMYEGTYPTLFINIDKGTLTLRRFMKKYNVHIDITSPKNFDDLQDIYEYLRYDNTKYKSVMIDSLTEFQRKTSMGLIKDETDDEMAYKCLSNSIPPDRREWLRSREHVIKFIRAFRDLSYLDDRKKRLHVIMTALEREDEKRAIVCPALPGALGLECGSFVDILGRLSTVNIDGKRKHHLLTQGFTNEQDVQYLAKNRGDLLGKEIWNPSVQKLVEVWQFEKEVEKIRKVEKTHGENKIKPR